jgi:amino acid transporter
VSRGLGQFWRRTVCLLCLAIVCGFACSGVAVAASSLGGANPLTEGGEEETAKTATTATTATTASTETSNTKSTSVLVIGLGAAALLLGGITFVIIRDVRRVAPATDAEMAARSSASDPAVALRKRRAKAKAARRQRKRNR